MSNDRTRLLLVFGTRPEAIKLFSVIERLRREPAIETRICVTAQQRELLDQTLSALHLAPDYDLDIMATDQSLFHVTNAILSRVEPVIRRVDPHLVVVQGDAQTTFCGALSAFYAGIPVAHIEAGLRTGDRYSPYPEEMNRILVDRIADLLFAPTRRARENLLREGIPEQDVFITGNTEIDALYHVLSHLRPTETFGISGRIVIATVHRRENFGEGIRHICAALTAIADRNSDVNVIFPVHPNPHVREEVERAIARRERITILEPIDYVSFVHLLRRADLVLTDSGGLQEAAVSLHVPLLVLRDETERTEGIDTGAALLVGTDEERILAEAERLLHDEDARAAMVNADNPYGNGRSADEIVRIIKERFA